MSHLAFVPSSTPLNNTYLPSPASLSPHRANPAATPAAPRPRAVAPSPARCAAETSSAYVPPPKTCECGSCDGYGKVLGGIAVILPWWPIKAYRPCKNFKGDYKRAGQSLDEIAFGKKGLDE